MPIFYDCQRCTACCRWPGQVRVSEGEISKLALHLGLSEFDFIQRFTQVTADRRGLTLIEAADGACVFLEDGLCTVQPVKPQQCRDFPNLWNFEGFRKLCHSIPVSVSSLDWVKRVAQATGRKPEEIAAPEEDPPATGGPRVIPS